MNTINYKMTEYCNLYDFLIIAQITDLSQIAQNTLKCFNYIPNDARNII